MESGLDDRPIAEMLAGLADRLLDAGIPVTRIQIAFRLLHPLFDFLSATWTRETGAIVSAGVNDEQVSRFEVTPWYQMLRDNAREFRRRIEPGRSQEFPILEELAASGTTDYFAQLTRFGTGEIGSANSSGMASSWATSKPEGFSEDAIAALRWIIRPLALAMKGYVKDQIARNALHTFHGPLVGDRILDGAIKRGWGERLHTVIWYSDLRNSTALADSLSTENFLTVLNAYLDCSAGAVLAQDGQVLEIIGDAVLGIFPVAEQEEESCAQACRAAAEAHRRLAVLKQSDPAVGQHLAFGLGLHLGEVIFGNVGTEERLAFGLVGGAVNEVARIESLTKSIGRPVLLADPVALGLYGDTERCVRAGLTDCGLQPLRGVANPLRLWAMPVPV
ncbi:MAG TPA: adenylate/guanylate cyclase domain-containing protein [Stellaceae bacterium]|nr:adenylate/guanylate cyclase domain-containing protein [Stellaceae bacterium]